MSVGYYSSVEGKLRTWQEKHYVKASLTMQQIVDYICFQLKGKDVQILRTKQDILLQQREPMKQPKSNPKYQCSFALVRVN